MAPEHLFLTVGGGLAFSVGVIGLLTRMPNSARLLASVAFMPLWLTLGRLNVDGVSDFARQTTLIAYMLVVLAAFGLQAPSQSLRRFLPQGLVNALVFSSVFMLAYAPVVVDSVTMLALRLQWIAAVLAALGLAKSLSTVELRKLFAAFALGASLSVCALLVFSLAEMGVEASFRSGRLYPTGTNPNQASEIAALATIACIICARQYESLKVRAASVVFGLVGLGFVALTASRRSLLLVSVFLAVHVVVAFFRGNRPHRLMRATAVTALAVGAFAFLISVFPDANVQRLLDPEYQSRQGIAQTYVGEIAERPLLGLLTSNGLSHFSGPGLTHPHNAYVSLAYQFGLLLPIPLVLVPVAALVRWLSFLNRRRFALISAYEFRSLGAIILGGLLHGLGSVILFYPTYSLPVMVLFASFAIFIVTDGRTDARQRKLVRNSGEIPKADAPG